MRILVVGLGYRGYTPFYAQALRNLGHQVSTYVGTLQYDMVTRLHRLARVRIPALLGVERDYSWSDQQRFMAWFRRARPRADLVLFANSDRLATDEILHEMRDAAIPTGIWLLDDVELPVRGGLDFRLFTHHATFSAVQAPRLTEAWGREFLYVPQGFAPIPFQAAAAPWTAALVLGNAYPSRRTAAEALLEAGYEVDVVGRTWPDHVSSSKALRIHKDVTLEQSMAMSSNSRICANGHRNTDAGVGPRVFEIAAAGGVLIDDNPRTPDFFEPGREMLTWASAGEIVEHAERLRHDKGLADRLSVAARRRALAEHRIDRRLAHLLHGWGL